MNVKHALDIV